MNQIREISFAKEKSVVSYRSVSSHDEDSQESSCSRNETSVQFNLDNDSIEFKLPYLEEVSSPKLIADIQEHTNQSPDSKLSKSKTLELQPLALNRKSELPTTISTHFQDYTDRNRENWNSDIIGIPEEEAPQESSSKEITHYKMSEEDKKIDEIKIFVNNKAWKKFESSEMLRPDETQRETKLRKKDFSKFELILINDKTCITDLTKISKRHRKSRRSRLRDLIGKHLLASGKEKNKVFTTILQGIRKKKKSRKERLLDTLKQWGHSLDNFKHGAIEKLHELAIPLNPLSKFRITWDILAAIFIVYEMIVDPYLLAFELEPEGSLDTLEVIKLIFFLLDILLNFHTAFYYEGNLKKKHKEIAKNYIQSTFFLDLIASFAALTLLGTKNNLARLLHFLRIYRFRIILRVIDDFAQGFILLNGILNLSVLILYLFLLCHWCACIWRYVGAYNLIADDASWMREHDYNLLNNADLYIVSFYWSVTTILTVGYGDILPKTSSERIITIFVMFLGCIIFSYSVNSVSKIANTIDAGMSKKRQKKYAFTKYMESHGISAATQAEVKQYLDFILEENRANKAQEESMLAMLSDNLREKIISEINGKILKQEKIFSTTFGTRFLSVLYHNLIQKTYAPRELIFDEFDKDFSIYFVASGSVKIFLTQTDTTLHVLEKGSTFGEISFFSDRKRTAAAQSIGFSCIFCLKKQRMLELLDENPIEKEIFCSIKDKINLYEDYSDLKIKCYACNKDGHYAAACPELHYVPDKEQIIKEYLAEENRFRRKFNRNFLRKRFRALLEKDEIAEAAISLSIKKGSKIKKERDFFSNQNKTIGEPLGQQETSTITTLNNVKNFSPRVRSEVIELLSMYHERERQVFNLFESLYKQSINLETEKNVQLESIQNFQLYFPHNNLTKILQNIEKNKSEKLYKERITVKIQEYQKNFSPKNFNQEEKAFTPRMANSLQDGDIFSDINRPRGQFFNLKSSREERNKDKAGKKMLTDIRSKSHESKSDSAI